MEESAKLKVLKHADKVCDNVEFKDVFRTIAHLFPQMIPVVPEGQKYVIFLDTKTNVSVTVALEDDV